jgi:hypothetical protein
MNNFNQLVVRDVSLSMMMRMMASYYRARTAGQYFV